ncbi:DUF5313 family protein [Nocardia sp. NPDC051030]|uniref:DUF5313 family protein n=1 Tax=Nocardia sp. NPDC051030 TaxID=3155162 RepID=UPI00341615B6
MTSNQQRRPTPIQWLGYAFGRRLPNSMIDWVRNDLTGKHAFARHLVRGSVPFLPLYAAFMFFPGALWIRVAMVALASILGTFYCAAYMAPNREHRLIQHGLPWNLEGPERIRQHELDRIRYLANYPH